LKVVEPHGYLCPTSYTLCLPVWKTPRLLEKYTCESRILQLRQWPVKPGNLCLVIPSTWYSLLRCIDYPSTNIPEMIPFKKQNALFLCIPHYSDVNFLFMLFIILYFLIYSFYSYIFVLRTMKAKLMHDKQELPTFLMLFYALVK